MSLPSWLRNTMGSPNPQGDRGQTLQQAVGIAPQQPFNGDSARRYSVLNAIQQAGMLSGPSLHGAEYVDDLKAFGSPSDAIVRRVTDRLIDKVPLTAAIKVHRIEVRFSGGEGRVLVIFDAHRRNPTPGEPLSLPLTDDFPTDADISRILLAMP